jgi:hypothetical protein
LLFCSSAFSATMEGELFWTKASEVTADIIDRQDGTYQYNFTVWNTSYSEVRSQGEGNGVPNIVDWEIPFFHHSDIKFITSPGGWRYTVEQIGVPNFSTGWEGEAQWMDPADDMYRDGSIFNTAQYVLHWHITGDGAAAIAPNGALGGFSMVAAAGPVDAPYQASWSYGPVLTGDPPVPTDSGLMLPDPSVIPDPGAVPEPATMMLFGLGLLGLAGFYRRQ